MSLQEEIGEQPAVLQRWLEQHLGAAREIAAAIQARGVRYVYIAARGSSDHAAIYAQYLWGSLNGFAVALAAPSLFSLYGQPPNLADALVVGISQSGQSPDIVGVLSEGRRQGALTLALTNDLLSPLAGVAELTLPLATGPERAVAATKTYTAELLALAALSVALSGEQPEQVAALWRVPQAAEVALGLERVVRPVAYRHQGMQRCVVLGRGYHYATAREWALKLAELSYVLAVPYSSADFQHGPLALMEPGFPVLAVAPRGVASDNLNTLLHRLRDEYGAHLVVLSDDPAALALGHDTIEMPLALPEWLAPIVTILPGQLFCYHLTEAKGYNTETPRGISKVTLTQ